jgi:hypothetical protein
MEGDMKLIESDPKLSYACRIVEEMCSSIAELSKLEIAVFLLPNFDNYPHQNNPYKKQPSLYVKSENRIMVNENKFFSEDIRVQAMILLHEVAHGFREQIKPKLLDYYERAGLHEDPIVDLLICQWGFKEQLIFARKDMYGQRYCEALARDC